MILFVIKYIVLIVDFYKIKSQRYHFFLKYKFFIVFFHLPMKSHILTQIERLCKSNIEQLTLVCRNIIFEKNW